MKNGKSDVLRKKTKRIVAYLLITSFIMTSVVPFFEKYAFAAGENLALSSKNNSSSSANENELHKLLYGFNVTDGKDLAEPDALNETYPIINPDSDYLDKVKYFSGTQGDSKSYSGRTRSEVINKYMFDSVANTFGKIYMVDAEVTASFNTSNRVKNAYSEYYQIFSKWIERHHYIVQLSTEEIRDYLSERFVQDLYSVQSKKDAKTLLSRYGTHLNTGYSFGGRMNVTNYMSSSDYSTDYSSSKELGTVLFAKFSIADFGGGADVGEMDETHVSTDYDSSAFMCKIYGGNPEVPNNVDELFERYGSINGVDKSGYGYEKWKNSVNADEHLVIIGIPKGAQSIPLWELLDDYDERTPQIRKNLIDAYIELCGDKYDEYQNKYKQLDRRIYKEADKSVFPTYNGLYIRTQNDFVYYVEADDFKYDAGHDGVFKNEYLYFDFETYDKSQNIEYECQGCEIVDSKNAIFKVTGNSGTNLIITMKIGKEAWKLAQIPIKEADFEGGTGSADYPYIIINKEQFSNVSKDTSSNYILCSDLDFGGKALPMLNDFKGCFDGNYCTISNFYIPHSQNWGLFGINTGTIKNLCIHDAGTSVNEDGFIAGGVDYGTDYENDGYTTNSIQATKAGMIVPKIAGQ